MRFSPKTEIELETARLLPEGTYDFLIKGAEDCISKKGNEMIKLTVIIYDKSGNDFMMFDYLLEAMAHKLRHFTYAVGLNEMYEQGLLTAESCINKSGKLELSVEAGNQKPDGGFYPAKNVIKDYLQENCSKTSNSSKKDIPNNNLVHPELDDDVPF